MSSQFKPCGTPCGPGSKGDSAETVVGPSDQVTGGTGRPATGGNISDMRGRGGKGK